MLSNFSPAIMKCLAKYEPWLEKKTVDKNCEAVANAT